MHPQPLAHMGSVMQQMLKDIGGTGMLSQEHTHSFMAQDALTDPFHNRSFEDVQNAVCCIGFLAMEDFGTNDIIKQLVSDIMNN